MPRISVSLPFIALIATLALAACAGNSNTSAPAPTAKPTATPQPFRDVIVTGRAIVRDVADEHACLSPAEHAQVAAVANDTPVPLALRALGATGDHCWREVRAGDSAYGASLPFAAFIPHVARGARASATFSGAVRPANSVHACIAAGRRAHVPTVAIETIDDAGMSAFKVTTCVRPISSDDSAADSSTQFTVELPAREIAK